MKIIRNKKTRKQHEQERELWRQKRRKELEAEHREREKFWKELGADWGYLSEPLEEFVSRKLKDEESKLPKFLSGKYRDREKIISTYQQKFVEYIRECCPKVIEELREFVPYFERLFGEHKHKYIELFDLREEKEILDLDMSLESKINHFIIKDFFLKFRPNRLRNFKYDYIWGEYRLLLNILYFLFVREENADKRNEILQETIKLLQDNLVIELDYNQLPADFDKSLPQKYIVSQSEIIIGEILFNDEHKFFREDAKRKIIEYLQDISPTPETSLADFIELQVRLLKWAKGHNLQKDWLLRYASLFIWQFSKNPSSTVSDLEIPALDIRSLAAYSFEFSFDGWLPGDEKKENYENRLIKSFESKLEQYFNSVGVQLDLDEQTKTTKAIKYDRVKWLVRRIVQGWSIEKIVELDFSIVDSLSTKEEFKRKVQYLKEEVSKFEAYDLPC